MQWWPGALPQSTALAMANKVGTLDVQISDTYQMADLYSKIYIVICNTGHVIIWDTVAHLKALMYF